MLAEEDREPYDYRNFPLLAAYIDRIEAEQINPRKFHKKVWFELPSGKRYYREAAVIRLHSDGTITVRGPSGNAAPEYEPTKEEAEAIKTIIQALAASWPTSIRATWGSVELRREQLGVKRENWFACPDVEDRTKVLWVQERKESETGDKNYYPHVLCSDGKWRYMEPDGDLPFWKPREKRNTRKLMIHEGAKAACFIEQLLLDRDAIHPWLEKLREYEHWGHMGGAMAIERADFNELHRYHPSEVVYVCDFDDPGQRALQNFSRKYRRPMVGIKFDACFPPSFDMADPIPQILFKDGSYIGPSLDELMVPATWATDLVGEGRKKFVRLRPEFASEWLHSIRPEAYINKRWPNIIYINEKQFNYRVAPFSDTKNVVDLLVKEDAGKVEQLIYSPALRSGVIVGPPRAINTYVPSAIRPREGDVGPWLDYLEYLFPKASDRKEVMRWVATIAVKLEIKMAYGVLLISETQGVGKTTLGEKVLAPLLGKWNVSFPNEQEICDSQFNDWVAHHRLACVSEIYAGQSSKAYNRVKELITDKIIRVNKKFMAAYDIENWCHMFACSNSLRALKMPAEDRRWFVPEVTEVKRPHSYWLTFNNWLETGGLEKIAYWAHEFLKENDPVRPGEPAPFSSAKLDMIAESYSPGQTLIADLLDFLLEECKEKRREDGSLERDAIVIVTCDQLLVDKVFYGIYEGKRNDKLEKPRTMRALAKAHNWYVGKKKKKLPDRRNGYLISNDPRYVTDEATVKQDDVNKAWWIELEAKDGIPETSVEDRPPVGTVAKGKPKAWVKVWNLD